MQDLNGKGIEIRLATTPRASRVYIDGQDVTYYVRRVEVIADAEDVTQVVLHCYNFKDSDFIVKGRLLIEE